MRELQKLCPATVSRGKVLHVACCNSLPECDESFLTINRGGSRIFFSNTNKPLSVFFFFCRIPVVLEHRRLSPGGGGAHPLHQGGQRLGGETSASEQKGVMQWTGICLEMSLVFDFGQGLRSGLYVRHCRCH